MFRREVLSSVAAGSMGMLGGIDQVDFEALQERNPGQDKEVIQEFSLQGNGVTKTAKNIFLEDGEDGSVATNAQVFEQTGSLSGWFNGGYRGENLSLENGEIDGPRLQGALELVKAENEPLKSSSYYIVWGGQADGALQDFSIDLPFKTIRATGAFEGTAIEGRIRSSTVPGFPIEFEIEGVQVEDDGPGVGEAKGRPF